MNEYHYESRRNDAEEIKRLRVSSPEEMIQKVKNSLLVNNGGLFILSAIGFERPVDGVRLSEQKGVFGFHFNKKEPSDTKDLVSGLEKAIVCKRLLSTLLFRKDTYNIDFKVDVSIPIFSNDYVITFDGHTGAYHMKMPYDKGTSTSNAKAFSEFIIGYFLYNNSVLLKRCSLDKYREYVDRFVYLYSMWGKTSLEQMVDELRITRNANDWDRLEAKRKSMTALEFTSETKKLQNIFCELCKKYRHQDNYLGKWADRFYKDNPSLF